MLQLDTFEKESEKAAGAAPTAEVAKTHTLQDVMHIWWWTLLAMIWMFCATPLKTRALERATSESESAKFWAERARKPKQMAETKRRGFNKPRPQARQEKEDEAKYA